MNYVKRYFLIVVAALGMVPAPMSANNDVKQEDKPSFVSRHKKIIVGALVVTVLVAGYSIFVLEMMVRGINRRIARRRPTDPDQLAVLNFLEKDPVVLANSFD